MSACYQGALPSAQKSFARPFYPSDSIMVGQSNAKNSLVNFNELGQNTSSQCRFQPIQWQHNLPTKPATYQNMHTLHNEKVMQPISHHQATLFSVSHQDPCASTSQIPALTHSLDQIHLYQQQTGTSSSPNKVAVGSLVNKLEREEQRLMDELNERINTTSNSVLSSQTSLASPSNHETTTNQSQPDSETQSHQYRKKRKETKKWGMLAKGTNCAKLCRIVLEAEVTALV